jgi:hypothetical protein
MSRSTSVPLGGRQRHAEYSQRCEYEIRSTPPKSCLAGAGSGTLDNLTAGTAKPVCSLDTTSFDSLQTPDLQQLQEATQPDLGPMFVLVHLQRSGPVQYLGDGRQGVAFLGPRRTTNNKHTPGTLQPQCQALRKACLAAAAPGRAKGVPGPRGVSGPGGVPGPGLAGAAGASGLAAGVAVDDEAGHRLPDRIHREGEVDAAASVLRHTMLMPSAWRCGAYPCNTGACAAGVGHITGLAGFPLVVCTHSANVQVFTTPQHQRTRSNELRGGTSSDMVAGQVMSYACCTGGSSRHSGRFWAMLGRRQTGSPHCMYASGQ